MSKKVHQPPALKHPQPYNHRDILTLQPVSQWRYKEEFLHLEHNRILAPFFSDTAPQEMINSAKYTGEEWLTDVCCPTLNSSLAIHLAKEMVLSYQIGEEDLNTEMHKAFDLLQSNTRGMSELQLNINHAVQNQLPSPEELRAMALNRLKQNGQNEMEITERKLKDAEKICLNILRRDITYQKVSEYIENNKPYIEQTLQLIPKNFYEHGENRDFSFLGAAGSGKSTISTQFLNKKEKKNYITLATDIYRGFTIPGIPDSNAGKNVFAQTQDLAYMIGDEVKKKLAQDSLLEKPRPNLIFDAVTLDNNSKKLLAQGTRITSAVAAYTGDGFVGIAERADHRARDPLAAPADKGRYVHTTSLLEGHANASSKLLTSLPNNVVTTIYDTNVEIGSKAIDIGLVDTQNNVVEIKNLRIMSTFLNKKNLNTEATTPAELLYPQNTSLNLLATHSENKAKSILDLIPATKFKKAYTVKLFDEQNQQYAELKSNETGKIILSILDEKTFHQKATAETVEAAILRSITRQAAHGNLEKSFNKAFEKGDVPSFNESLDNIRYNSYLRKTNLQNELKKIKVDLTESSKKHTPQSKNNKTTLDRREKKDRSRL